MARTQSDRYPEIRLEILGRSAAVFAEKGYARSTIEDLAEACKASRGALYHYFENKEAILDEILSAHLDMLLRAIVAAASPGASPEARLRKLIRTMVMVNATSQNEQIVLLNDLQHLGKRERDAIVKKQNDILAVVGGAIRAVDGGRKITARNLKAQVMMYIGMINYTYLWYDPEGAVAPEEYAAMVADACLAGLRA